MSQLWVVELDEPRWGQFLCAPELVPGAGLGLDAASGITIGADELRWNAGADPPEIRTIEAAGAALVARLV